MRPPTLVSLTIRWSSHTLTFGTLLELPPGRTALFRWATCALQICAATLSRECLCSSLPGLLSLCSDARGSAPRYYAGAPLLVSTDENKPAQKMGTFCVIDTKPRQPLTEQERDDLLNLAAMVVDQLKSRLHAKRLAKMNDELLRRTDEVSPLYPSMGPAHAASRPLHGERSLAAAYPLSPAPLPCPLPTAPS